MTEKTHPRNTPLKMYLGAGILLLLGIGAWYWLTPPRLQIDSVPADATPSAGDTQPSPRAFPVPRPPDPREAGLSEEDIHALQSIIDDLARARKETYGLEEELAEVLLPDEGALIGGQRISMADILDQIHKRENLIIENNLYDADFPPAEATDAATTEKLLRKLAELETRLSEITKLLNDSPDLPASMRKTLESEQQKASRLVDAGKKYSQLSRQLEELSEPAHTLRNDQSFRTSVHKELRELQRKLEKELRMQLFPPASIEAYGIYLVQPGDNIWQIHYRILRNSFKHQDMILPPQADRPDRDGFSSGVGKILKFAETMAYIYNIQKEALMDDLDRLQPQQQIVIFNMQRIFSMLEQIDINRLNEIIFDGEVLWIPAE